MQLQHTTKAGEAIQNAQKLATESNHPELTPTHLAISLLQTPEGVMSGVLQKLGVDARVLAGELVLALDKLPRAEGSQLAPSRAFVETMNTSAELAKKLGDEFISTEHLLLALAKKGGPEVVGLFTDRDPQTQRARGVLPHALAMSIGSLLMLVSVLRCALGFGIL